MSFTKNYQIKCDYCGKFCAPYDEETPFGCKDPEYPEPLDPYHYCKKCSKKLEKYWFDKLSDKNNWYLGSWSKSNAERKAAQRLGLVWLHSNGVGTYGTKTDRQPYQYITQSEFDELSKLPRYI